MLNQENISQISIDQVMYLSLLNPMIGYNFLYAKYFLKKVRRYKSHNLFFQLPLQLLKPVISVAFVAVAGADEHLCLSTAHFAGGDEDDEADKDKN